MDASRFCILLSFLMSPTLPQNVLEFKIEEQFEIQGDVRYPETIPEVKSNKESAIYKLFQMNDDKVRLKLPLTWNNCGTPADMALIQNLTIHPAEITGGQTLQLSLNVKVTKEITRELKTSLNVWRLFEGQLVPVPCSFSYFGDCNFTDLCETLAEHWSPGECPQFLTKIGFNCECPFDVGTYDLVNHPILVPQAVSAVAGTYVVTARASTHGQQAFCVNATVTIH